MGNVAIQVEGLGKLYRIGGKQERYRTLRDTLTDTLSAPFKRARSLLRGQAYGAAGLEDAIWALKDVSFEVKHGEVVGIIGRNGAGKSTLLKILSRITEPTEGYVDIYGRVGALLEVGTGFHPELTGRENIYLNGAILGMSRAEIDRKFDEIVAFAGVEKFIDTPVKHYSSGMGLRLGFSVAAHLEPEILVVDEVLAVGDAEFQKKCLGKMQDVAGEGRTVLFVSHNMGAIRQLCTRATWLVDGTIKRSGNVSDIISHYLSENNDVLSNAIDLTNIARTQAKFQPLIRGIRIFNGTQMTSSFETYGSFRLEVDCLLQPQLMRTASLGFVISDIYGDRVLVSHFGQYKHLAIKRQGITTFNASIEHLPILPGRYKVSLHLSDGNIDLDVVENALEFEVRWNHNIPVKYPPRANWGKIYVPVNWKTEEGQYLTPVRNDQSDPTS